MFAGNRKKWFYGTSLFIIYYGVIIANSADTYTLLSYMNQFILNADEYTFLSEQFQMLQNLIQALSFSIPFALTIFYTFPIFKSVFSKHETSSYQQARRRVMNAPYFLGLIAATGWIITFFFSLFPFFTTFQPEMLGTISKMLFLYSILAFISFAIVYFTFDFFNRLFIISWFFPEGRISDVPKIINISIIALFFFLFFCVYLIPFVIVFALLLNGEYLKTQNEMITALIIMNGLFCLILVYLVSKTFQKPLKAMKKAIEQIRKADYEVRLKVLSADEMGHLSEGINEMVAELREKETIQKLLNEVQQQRKELKLANQKMKKLKELAEEATRAKSDFLANMSHEIRTPMNAILGLNDLLQKTLLTDKQADYARKIGISAKNLLGIINDILDFSKIEAGRMQMENIDFKLDDVLDNLSNLISQKAYEKGLELIIAKSPHVPEYLRGDPLRLQQVLLNLINNAIKFTSTGEVVVKIQCSDEPDKDYPDKIHLQISVEDTGIGMKKEHMEKLFQAFNQADASTTRKYGGTGLGLLISKNIVELMHGQISVRSEYQKGSCFSFSILLEKGQYYESEFESLPEKFKGLKVLIADDNAAARQVLEEYITDFGMVPVLFATGEEALDSCDESYELLLIDWKMTGMDGIETWQQIQKKLHGKSRPKVFIITAYEKDEIVRQSKEAQVDEILIKPITQSHLLDSILNTFGADKRILKKKVNDLVLDEGKHRLIDLVMVKGARILLVEDNDINQQVARETLEDEGFFVDVAKNGLEACDSVRKAPYDLVLMDLQMPILDGFEATKRIRSDQSIRSDLPIVALTADAMSSTRDQVLQSGMNDYLSKPIDKSELFRLLVKWIKPGNREIRHSETTPSQTSLSSLHAFQGVLKSIDISSGLKRVSNKQTLYLTILKKFRKSHEDFMAKLFASQKDKDNALLLRMLHTLKGVSANIGATDLSIIAK